MFVSLSYGGKTKVAKDDPYITEKELRYMLL
jgi:hypothetical protein